MKQITKEVFSKWVETNNWLMVNEAAQPTGWQRTYLTPSGNMIVVLFDLKGNVLGFGQIRPGGQSGMGV